MKISANAGRQRNTTTGFTLLELLIVLVIVGIVIGVTAPRFTFGPNNSVEHQADRVVTLLASARSKAKSAGRPIETSPELLLGELPTGFSLRPVDEASRTVRFLADGTTSGGSWRISFEEQERVIQIDWLTGLATHALP